MTDHSMLGLDRYSVIARLYPAVLCALPALWTVVLIVPQWSAARAMGSALASACLMYLLTTIARHQGKLIERRLLRQWGGWPTTTLLRHRNRSIEAPTKARYHAALSTFMGLENLPTAEQEAASPGHADHLYRSATRRLLEQGRGNKLVQAENESYGFRRNLYALRTIAVVVAATALLISVLANLPSPLSPQTVVAAARKDPHVAIAILLDVCYAGLILLTVSRRFVRRAADDYALALFRTLDQRTGRTAPARKTRSS
jgi:hypothetical protein